MVSHVRRPIAASSRSARALAPLVEMAESLNVALRFRAAQKRRRRSLRRCAAAMPPAVLGPPPACGCCARGCAAAARRARAPCVAAAASGARSPLAPLPARAPSHPRRSLPPRRRSIGCSRRRRRGRRGALPAVHRHPPGQSQANRGQHAARRSLRQQARPSRARTQRRNGLRQPRAHGVARGARGAPGCGGGCAALARAPRPRRRRGGLGRAQSPFWINHLTSTTETTHLAEACPAAAAPRARSPCLGPKP
jgi:hypothetical protein